MTISRRALIGSGIAAGAAGLVGGAGFWALAGKPKETKRYEVFFSDAEWKARLSPAAFAVLRQESTERPFSSPLNDEHRAGLFGCAGCRLPLFSSRTKFDSGTGWPSFWQPLPNAVGTSTDHMLGYARTEVHCRRCGGHLGHVFDDGPQPTGKRYCMNGVAMIFKPTKG